MFRSQEPLLLRTRLLQSVSQHANARIILISAPAGYGKSVLANQIVEQLGMETAYQRVSVWQRDLPTLYDSSRESLQSIVTLDPIDETLDPEQAVIDILQTLEDRGTPLSYVIDDIHHLVDFHRAEQWLQLWLNHLPPNVTLILSGRQLPPLSLAQYVHRNEVVAYGVDLLALSPAELLELAPDLLQEQADRLITQFSGWIAGIKLALALPEKDPTATVTIGEPQELFHNLLVNVFQEQAPDFQSFLMLSSTLDVVTAAGCKVIFGERPVDHHLDRVHDLQLFISSSTTGMQYHDLFRDFLQQHLRRYDHTLYCQTHQQVAEWYHEQDETEMTIAHYIEAHCYEDAASLAKHIAHSFYLEGQKELLLYLYDLLQDYSPPELILYCGTIYTERREFELSRQLLEYAHAGFKQQENDAQAIRTTIQLAFNAYRAGKYEDAITQLDRLEISYPDMKARSDRIQGLIHLELGNFDQAAAYLLQALDGLTRFESIFGQSVVLQDLSEVYLRAGKLDEAGTTLKEAVALKRDLKNADELALALNNLGHYNYRNAAYDDAIANLEEGLDTVSSMRARATAYLYWTLADVYRAIGMHNDAERYYETARKLAGEEEYLYVGVMLSLVTMRCMQGYWHDAQHILNHITNIETTTVQAIIVQFMQSAVQTVIRSESYEALDNAIHELYQRNAKLKLADSLGIYLFVGWQSGRADMMKRGIALLRKLPVKLWVPVASFIVNFPQLESELLQEPALAPMKAYCDQLRRRHNTIGMSLLRPTSYELSLYTLGQDRILLNGHEVKDWTVSFARELFLYLYLNGKKTRLDLHQEFWHDRDIEQAMATFHTTRNRIRKALGEQAIVYDSQYYSISTVFDVQADCNKFEDYARRARHLPLSDARAEDLLHRAERLYQGDFLPLANHDWVVYRRQYYQELYVDVLQRLAESCELRADYTGAIRLYEQATDIEPLTENLYRQIMLCWGRLGRRDMMIHTYRKLEERLQKGIQMQPSPRTQAFYKSLIQDVDE